jgi:1,4-dihydroxy-2-naphthoate octaprenyltransferase
VLRSWLSVLRLEFQLDNLFPWFTAVAVACASGRALHVGWLALGTVMLVLSQAALELCDGYYDFVQGAHGRKDGAPTWTGGSGVLAEGRLAPKKVQIAAFATGAIAALVFAIVTIAWTRTGGLVVGLIGATCGAFWAMPPLKLSYRGLGEVLQAIVVGPLMAAEAWVVATGHLDARAFAVGVPFGLVEFAMGLSHNMIDRERDAAAGKRTLVVRIGLKWAARLHAVAMIFAVASLALLGALGVLHTSAFVACAIVAPFVAFACGETLRAARDERARDALGRSFPAFRVLVVLGIGALASALPSSREDARAIMLVFACAAFGPALVWLSKMPRPTVYDLFARIYNPVSRLLRFENRVRREAVNALAPRAGAPLLDLGCGTGFHFPELRAASGAGSRVVGIDPSAPSLDVARARAIECGLDFVAIHGDGASAPIAEPSFGGVIAAFSLSVMQEWRTAISRAAARLEPGARFVVLEQDVPEDSALAFARPFFTAANKFLGATLDRDYAEALASAGLDVTTSRYGAYAVFVGEKPRSTSPGERDGSIRLHVDEKRALDADAPALARGKVELRDGVLDAADDRVGSFDACVADDSGRARVANVSARGDVDADAHADLTGAEILDALAGDLRARRAQHGVDPLVVEWLVRTAGQDERSEGDRDASSSHALILSKKSYLAYLAKKDAARGAAFDALLATRPRNVVAASPDARAGCALLERLVEAEAWGLATTMNADDASDPLFFITREEGYHVRIGDALLALFGRMRRPPAPSRLARAGVWAMSRFPGFLSDVLVYWGERFGSSMFVRAADRIVPSLPATHRAYARALFFDLVRDEAEHTAYAHAVLGPAQRALASLFFPVFRRLAARDCE